MASISAANNLPETLKESSKRSKLLPDIYLVNDMKWNITSLETGAESARD